MHKLFYTVVVLFGLFSVEAYSQGDLYITPNRIVFEGRKQKEILSLANTGDETATYTISFVQRRMNEDGSFTVIETADNAAPFADPYLRIYPRTVTLGPKEGQTIILQVKRSALMPDGEYRSHLYFRSEKDYTPLGSEKKDTIKSVSVKLIPIYGISIPVIIRSGNISVTTTITNLNLDLKKDKKELMFTLNREGNASVYGDVTVEYIKDNKKPVVIGNANGIAVYTNINKRKIAVALNLEGVDLSKGKLKVSYAERDDKKLIAETEIILK